jgi:hypothetical protein
MQALQHSEIVSLLGVQFDLEFCVSKDTLSINSLTVASDIARLLTMSSSSVKPRPSIAFFTPAMRLKNAAGALRFGSLHRFGDKIQALKL